MPSRAIAAARRLLAFLPLLLALGVAGCDRLRAVADKEGGSAPTAADDGAALQWRGDSTLLAARPGVLFRVVRDGGQPRAVPLARLGRDFGILSLGSRGWRAFDVAYLYAGRAFTPLRGGTPLAPIPSTRGMWEGDPLDSLPGCRAMLPGAAVSPPEGVELLVAGAAPRYLPAPPLAPGAMAQAVQTLTTLVAPSAGVGMAALRRYRRALHVIPVGTAGAPAVLALYDNPAPLPDSANLITQPPRFLAVLLEPGLYGYRAAWQYATLGTPGQSPRLQFLGYLDADGDGGTELFFGVADPRVPLHLLVLRRDGDRWLESIRSARARCLG